MNKALIADMDGTILTVNSWHIFSKEVLKELAGRGSYFKAGFLCFKTLQRKLRLIGHREVKYYFAKASQEFDDNFFRRLTQIIVAHANKRVMDFIYGRRKDGYTIILATAAAGEYARLIGENLNFDYIIASPKAGTSLDEYSECKGIIKAKEVEKLLREHNLEAEIVITDHWHDLDLMKHFQEAEIYLVNPSSDTSKVVKDSKINISGIFS